MSKRTSAALIVTALIAMALGGVAWADHVQEPTDPIDGLEMDLSNYVDHTTIITDTQCASGGAFIYNFPRVHWQVSSINHGAGPSEHWQYTFEVLTAPLDQDGNRIGPLSINTRHRINHQNHLAHRTHMGIDGGDVFALGFGKGARVPTEFLITATVTGLESGQVLTRTCHFRYLGSDQ